MTQTWPSKLHGHLQGFMQDQLTISMVLEDLFLLLQFFTHPPGVHPYFYLSTTVFTSPNDWWTGLCIKLCSPVVCSSYVVFLLPSVDRLYCFHSQASSGFVPSICIILCPTFVIIVLSLLTIFPCPVESHNIISYNKTPQGFIFRQDQIIASHTCFGGHMDVNW